jgi:two-component system, NtrC family, sensor kinase
MGRTVRAPLETVDLTIDQHEEDAEALRKANLVHAIAQLAAGLAHEINNPAAYMAANLQILKGILERISGHDAQLEEARRIIAENCHGIGRITGAVKNLLAVSQIERGRFEEVNLNEVVNSACSIAYNQLRHRAQLIKSLGNVPNIVADRGKLTQVLLNLLMTAVDGMEDGPADLQFVEVRTERIGTDVVVSVTDSTRAGPRSIGIGLAVCVDILRQHNGDLRVMSDGRGSRFDVVLPMENGLRGEVVSPRPAREESALVPEGARVLLIDDETMILKAYARMLGDTCDVVTVAGGREALELLRFDRNFDVVICDLMMPYVDGPMIYDEIRRNVPDLLPRMIFCSGGAFTARVRSFAGALGEQTLLEKPVPPDVLKAAIARVTRSGQASVHARTARAS